MDDTDLFGERPAEPRTPAAPAADAPPPPPPPPPRLRRPDRAQVVMRPCSLDEVIPAGHDVRTLWAVVERLDLAAFHAPLRARGEAPGRAATDPRLLVALWLWAATQGEGSARRVARLCGTDDTYRWLCGGVSVNHHTLGDFRVGHAAALDELFTLVLAMLIGRGLVRVTRISQDGLRVRAAAGRSSFRRRETLDEHLAAAQEQVRLLKLRAEAPDGDGDGDGRTARERAAQERAARGREARVAAALARMPELEAAKARRGGKRSKRPPRASTTDAEATVMKMPDGGFAPAFNVQLAQDTGSRAIVGVDVTTRGTDHGQSEPMRAQVERRAATAAAAAAASAGASDGAGEAGGGVGAGEGAADPADPAAADPATVAEHLMDGGFVKLAVIGRAEAAGVKVYAPPKATAARPDPFARCGKDTDATAAWRARMGTDAGKAVYKLRAATAETVNADLRTYRGLGRIPVRGLGKVRCLALWSALAYNLMHFGAALLTG